MYVASAYIIKRQKDDKIRVSGVPIRWTTPCPFSKKKVSSYVENCVFFSCFPLSNYEPKMGFFCGSHFCYLSKIVVLEPYMANNVCLKRIGMKRSSVSNGKIESVELIWWYVIVSDAHRKWNECDTWITR